MSILNQKCLTLNKNWQAIGEQLISDAVVQMFSGAACGMCIDGENEFYPVSLEEWLKLPLRDGDVGIHTARLVIREPRVVLCGNYSHVPKRRPKLCLKTIAERDSKQCQYTGKVLSESEMSLDHVIPRSRGGLHNFKNLVLCSREFNGKKGNALNSEIGARLLKEPREPMAMPMQFCVRSSHPDHALFLKE